jgi:hypothetical protein
MKGAKMRRMLMKFGLALAVVTVAAFGADNSLGTWKLNMSKSKFDPGPGPVKSLTSMREAADGGVKVTSTGEQANSTPINSSYTAADSDRCRSAFQSDVDHDSEVMPISVPI